MSKDAGPILEIPEYSGRLQIDNTTVALPKSEKPLLQGLNFAVEPGEALAVLGPTGAGKSSLARVLTGAQPVTSGSVRFDGATREQWDNDRLGLQTGYLPQNVAIFDGTISENIARMQECEDTLVVEAARTAGIHDMILGFPDGYNTMIGPNGVPLSGGQLQLIGLARTFFNNPNLLILDEPNSHLDTDGENLVVQAVQAAKARGASVIIMAHRPSILTVCDNILILKDGQQVTFGPSEQVMKSMITNVRPAPENRVAS